MSLFFRTSKKIAPGVRLNLGTRSAGAFLSRQFKGFRDDEKSAHEVVLHDA